MKQKKRRTGLNWTRLGTTEQERERVQQKRELADKNRRTRAQHDHLQAKLKKKHDSSRVKTTKI